MDPIEKLNLALDSSLRIASALARHGEKSYLCQLSHLFWSSGKHPSCTCQPLDFDKDTQKIKLGTSETWELRSFRSIHMRKDPPFDLNYIAATWFLDPCSEDVLLVNHPHALRGFNEKLGVLWFPKESKKSLVASQVHELLNFLKNLPQKEAIIKPLDLYGGKGVQRVFLNENSEKLLETLTEKEKKPILIQEFDRNIYQGEVRAFSVGGNVLNWSLKVPKEGEFLANTHYGSSVQSFTPSKPLIEKIEKVSQELLKSKIYFVGFDIISEEISEINITSPRLLSPKEDTTDYYEDIASWILQSS